MTKSIVLLSGGIDSATCLAIACRDEEEVLPIHFTYGQQTAELEFAFSNNQRHHISEQYPSKLHDVRTIKYESVFGHFAEGVAEEGKKFAHMNEEDGRSSGYVPMRNLHFIASGAAVADHEGAESVYIGAQYGDHADYPDCREEFLRAASEAVSESLPEGENITLKTPLLESTKTEVVELGDELGVNFGFTYSCYEEPVSMFDPEVCGNCPACEERIAAFKSAGVEDPHAP